MPRSWLPSPISIASDTRLTFLTAAKRCFASFLDITFREANHHLDQELVRWCDAAENGPSPLARSPCVGPKRYSPVYNHETQGASCDRDSLSKTAHISFPVQCESTPLCCNELRVSSANIASPCLTRLASQDTIRPAAFSCLARERRYSCPQNGLGFHAPRVHRKR